MTFRRILTLAAAPAVIAGAAAAYWLHFAVPAVQTAQPTRGPAVQAVYATGDVEAVHWAKVTPLVRGRIVDLCVCEGKPIRKGDFLVKLDDREVRAELEKHMARAGYLAEEVERYRRLLERKVVSIQAYERVASERAELQAAIAAARQRLGHYQLRSPMDGVVLRRDGEVGEVVGPDDIVVWVGKPRPLRITAEVDEEDIPMIRVGQRALIKADAFPGRALEGRVDHVTPKGDPRSKSFRVRLSLPRDTPLMIGMTTEINVVVKQVADALLVPASTLDDGHVWIVEGGRSYRRRVEVGIEGDTRVEIVAGLTGPEAVVVEPGGRLAEGGRVRVRPRQ